MTEEHDEKVQKVIDDFAAELREGMKHLIGEPIKVERLREAARKVFDSWEFKGDLIHPDRDFLMPALEVTFGIRDPMDLIEILEKKTILELEQIYEQYGKGPADLFGLVLFGKKGDLKYEVTEHRPGYLGMNMMPAMPVNFITVTIDLGEEKKDDRASSDLPEEHPSGDRAEGQERNDQDDPGGVPTEPRSD